MKEKPILFSTPMVQAIQADTKNQTRRTAGLEKVNGSPDDYKLYRFFTYFNPKRKFVEFTDNDENLISCKPRYMPGDHIWVKETHCYSEGDLGVTYKTDYTEEQLKTKPKSVKWKPSLFMRKEYARIWLKCTGVRCERLLDISGNDARNEGILEHDTIIGTVYKIYAKKGTKAWDQSPVVSYMSLWDSINGEGSYLKNPWVFIYDFQQIEK